METSQLVKVYTLDEIKKIAKNYSVCTIEDMNGKKITTWNPIKKPILQHLADCLERLKLDIYDNGYYNVCFVEAVRFQKDHHKKYLICKGKPTSEPVMNNNNNNNQQNKNDLLSVTSALNYITQIAELKTENNRLTMENKQLKDENAVLEAELEEFEREEGLSEGKGSDTMTFLKDQSPVITNAIDRYFELQDKKLNIEQQKIDKGLIGANKEPGEKKNVKRSIKKMEVGSPEHLNYIRLLYKEEKEEAMNKEIDKLELLNPEKYQEICTELNLFEDETNDNNEN